MLSNACSGAALLVEAANMGDPDAQYELGCRLRIEVFTSCPLSFLLNESITRFLLGNGHLIFMEFMFT